MADETKKNEQRLCGLPPVAARELESPIDPRRARLIRNAEKKWVNGTVLRYFFLDQPASIRGPEAQKQAVRQAFAEWKELGLGLGFQETASANEAEIRIGFDQNDGSWSYVGRDAIDHASNPAERTMNFGWDLTTPYGRDTALHEIGHALGFPHEHQNPLAGIIWNEPAVYQYFAGPPNHWSQQTTEYNIIRKLDPGEVQGSNWDRNSIMHYQFQAGLIDSPAEFRTRPLIPEAGLSAVDKSEALRFYPTLAPEHPELKPWALARVDIDPGEQLDWVIRPQDNRVYDIQTFGQLDTVLVLFENINGEPRYLDGDDDSGWNLNASMQTRLFAGREYILRLRLYSSNASGGGALLMY